MPSGPGTTSVALFAGTQLLMGKRRDNGKWTLPGGGLEPNELPFMGALRELEEEAGFEALSLTPLGAETVQGRTGRTVTVHAYKASVNEPIATRTSQDPDLEVAAWEWVETSKGLPKEIVENLQSPRNVVLMKLRLL